MDTNEIMVQNEVFEVAEKIAETNPRTDYLIGMGVGSLAVLGSIIAYKYLIKPAITKIREKKGSETIVADFKVVDDETDGYSDETE